MNQILILPVRRGWVRSGLPHAQGSHMVGCTGRRRREGQPQSRGVCTEAGLPLPGVCRCCRVGGWGLGRTEMNLAVLDLVRLGLMAELKEVLGSVSKGCLSKVAGGGAPRKGGVVPGQCKLLWMAGQASW